MFRGSSQRISQGRFAVNDTYRKARSVKYVGQELAEKILITILKNPEMHDQSEWGLGDECGTTACVCGHAAIINGDAEYRPEDDEKLKLKLKDLSRYVNWEEYGKQALGLKENDSYRLFYKCSNAQAVEALAYLARGEKIDWSKVSNI